MESGTTNPTNASKPTATNEINGAGRSMTVSASPPTTPTTAPITLKAMIRSASHPGGAPASMIFFAIRSRVSSGVILLAMRPARATIGTSTR